MYVAILHERMRLHHRQYTCTNYGITEVYHNSYILGAFTAKPYNKQLERNVVYTAIITMSHATSHDVK